MLILQQIQALSQNVSAFLPFMPHSRFPPTRVFQIHTTASCPTRPNSLIFSWPPARVSGSTSCLDGSYDADEYSNLMREVDMSPKPNQSGGRELRTNCTSRFGARHTVTTEGVYRHITSVFIPYGNLIFSCFQTNKQVELQRTQSMSQVAPFADPISLGYGYAQPQPDWSNPLEWSSMPLPTAATYPSQSPYFDEKVFDTAFTQTYPDPSPTSGPSKPKVKSTVAGNGGSNRPMVKPPGDVECCRICQTEESPEWRRSESGVKDLCNAQVTSKFLSDEVCRCGLRLARQVAKREGRQRPRKKKEKSDT